MKTAYLGIALLLVTNTVAAYGDGTETQSPGAAIYGKYCTVCHGAKGLSNTTLGQVLEPPPRKLADPVAMARIDDQQIYLSIKDGKIGTAMPAWSRLLNDQQIQDVAAYVKSLKQPRPAGMTQDDFDIAVGGQIYRRYCVICHGTSGNHHTRISQKLVLKPENFTNGNKMSRLSDAELAQAIAYGKSGTAMVGWNSLLSSQDIRCVVMYIRHEFVPKK